MDDEKTEPTGPPPVAKSTKINIKTTSEKKPAAAAASKTEAPIDKAESKPTEMPEADVAPEPTTGNDSSPIPVTAADKDLQSIDMSDDTAAPAPPRPKKAKSGGSKKGLKIVIVILVLLVLAAGAWWVLKKPKASPPAPAANKSSNTTTSQTAQPTTPTIKTYKNDTIKVELSYPSTWKTTETGNQVMFTSPQVSYTKKDGSTTKGSFRLIVQKGFTQTDSTTINNAVAVKTSENLKYTAPATGQRTESFLSFLGTDKTTFNFILITSGKQYNPGDTVAATLPLSQDSYIVAGGYGEGKGENIDFDSISVTKIDQNNVYGQAVDIIKSLKITG